MANTPLNKNSSHRCFRLYAGKKFTSLIMKNETIDN